MKLKNICLAAVLAFTAWWAYAGPLDTVNGIAYPQMPGTLVTEAVYHSSVTCVNIAAGTEVNISSRPAWLFSVAITSPGIGNPTTELFDARASTTGFNRRLTGKIDGRQVGNYIFEIGTSTGITIRNYGDVVAPCVTVVHVEKR